MAFMKQLSICLPFFLLYRFLACDPCRHITHNNNGHSCGAGSLNKPSSKRRPAAYRRAWHNTGQDYLVYACPLCMLGGFCQYYRKLRKGSFSEPVFSGTFLKLLGKKPKFKKNLLRNTAGRAKVD